ncbi:MAG: hypothetical protein ACE5HX_19570, partial [bacterium]
MKSNIENKEKFIEKVEKKYAELKASFQSLKDCVNPNDESTELDVKRKHTKLEACFNSLDWKIEHFKNNSIHLDNTVKNSFAELIDEIEWRIKEVEMGLKGK